MSYRRLLFVVSTVSALGLADKKLTCSNYRMRYFSVGGFIYTCVMGDHKIIRSTGFTFDGAADLEIEALRFEQNMDILYLPEKVAEKFPDLEAYRVDSCRLKVIKRVHFENLTKLRYLRLFESEITQIGKGTFDDLIALEYLDLGRAASSLFD
jgi:hypothetical protein